LERGVQERATTDGLAIVRTSGPDARQGRISYGGMSYECALGRGGCRLDKREGDGATPIGTWPIRRVLYRADRIERPATALPVAAIGREDGWCDAPADANYNRPVRHPYHASAEHLWREDNLYDLVAILGHNDDPVVPGAGSANFVHVASADFAPTAGCVALRLADLLELLAAPGLQAIRVE
jgi:L,D-peptidoglycan transpeptidase YkuD (ErfK/YbiS/YcfS/YnhG family)